VELSGSVEIMINLGVADAIVDLVETGSTLAANRLRVLDEIGRYETVLVQNHKVRDAATADRIVRRLEGIVIARNWSLLEYNVPRTRLAEAEKITPGFNSPTVSGLEDPDWCAVRSMVKRGEAHAIMERLDAIGASFVRNIDAGEVVVIGKDGVESLTPFPNVRSTPCIFEYVYFARPDSIMHGRSVYETRQQFGRILARESHVDADLICPVPDGGNPAALGYAEASGIPFGFGIIRNHYVGRTFIQPTQSGRQRSISRKHAPNNDHCCFTGAQPGAHLVISSRRPCSASRSSRF
jgi:ATP phosphoribosyltransferase-like protein